MNSTRPLLCVLVLLPLTLLVTMPAQVTCAQTIVAHRGASDAAPENTIAAFKLAWELGADLIEGDFYLTSDGHIVAIHDKTTKRTAGVDLPVSKSTFAQLRQLDVGTWKSPKYCGERIPTLAEVLAIVPSGKKILIEIKCGPEIVPKLKEELAQSSLQPEQTVVIAFDEAVVRAVKDQIPQLKVYWLTGYKQDKKTKKWSPTLKTVLDTLKSTGADGLDTQANTAIVNASFVQAIRQNGYEFHTWTIDDPEAAQHFQQLGVDSITTNCPRKIRDSLQK